MSLDRNRRAFFWNICPEYQYHATQQIFLLFLLFSNTSLSSTVILCLIMICLIRTYVRQAHCARAESLVFFTVICFILLLATVWWVMFILYSLVKMHNFPEIIFHVLIIYYSHSSPLPPQPLHSLSLAVIL
jgi:hypothetical protein